MSVDGSFADTAHPVRQAPPARTRAPMEVRVAHWLRKNFVVPSGVSQGQPFELHPFQMELLR
ncbi:MAG: hypothetical protein AAFY38_17150 [Pseudomonadota bacterium]